MGGNELVRDLSNRNNIEDLNNFKEIIENQERIINHLITILHRGETKNNLNNEKNGDDDDSIP
jgi:hypothetical protein